MTRVTLVVLVAALAFACGSPPDRTPTEEESVRASFRRVREAVLAGDFAREWELLAPSAREHWGDRHAQWRALDAGSPKWAELEAEHGLTREEFLQLDVPEFFVACGEALARLSPDEWMEEMLILRSLGPGVVEFQGKRSASMTFQLPTDPDVDVHVHVRTVRFEKEGGAWRILQQRTDSVRLRFPRTEWNEPILDLAWAHGADDLDTADIGLFVNVLVDGSVVVSGSALDETALRERLAAHAAVGSGVAFRCDARVPYRTAARWLGLMIAVGIERVACAVTKEEGGRCMRPTPKTDRIFFQSCEQRLDYEPPVGPLASETLDAVIDVGPPAIDADTRDRLTAQFAAMANARERARVLVNPSADATWDAVVRVLAALRAGGIRSAVLAESDVDAIHDGVRVHGRWPPDLEGAGKHTTSATARHASWRVLGER